MARPQEGPGQERQKIGIFFDLDGPLAMECIALAGFGYAIVDLEHGPLAVKDAVELIARGHLHGMRVLVRTQDASRTAILKALDAGADGVLIPGIRSLEEARQAVAFGKYPPVGSRGVAMARAAFFGCHPEIKNLPELFAYQNARTLLVLQCETRGCLEAVREIAALEGVNGLFVGPYDLSTDMGLAGQFEHASFVDALSRVQEACRAAQKPVWIFCPDALCARLRLQEGYDAVAVSTASSVLIGAGRNLLAQVAGQDP